MHKTGKILEILVTIIWLAILAAIIGYFYIQQIHEVIGDNIWIIFVVEIFTTALCFSLFMYNRVKKVLINNNLLVAKRTMEKHADETNNIDKDDSQINKKPTETLIKEHHRIIIKEVEDDSQDNNQKTEQVASDAPNDSVPNSTNIPEPPMPETPEPESPKPAEKIYEMQAEPIPPSTVPIIFKDDLIAYVAEGWKEFFKNEQKKEYFNGLINYVSHEYRTKNITPMKEDLFKPFAWCDVDETKVVILGIIPLSNNVADGLAFSTYRGLKPDVTTTNLLKECVDDVNIPSPDDTGCLVPWASRGVMLMNIFMTSPIDNPLGHSSCGYQELTTSIIQELNDDAHPKVFVLWGNAALKYENFITNPNHKVIKSSGPYSMSAYNGFFGSKPFSQINEFLIANKVEPIDWSI